MAAAVAEATEDQADLLPANYRRDLEAAAAREGRDSDAGALLHGERIRDAAIRELSDCQRNIDHPVSRNSAPFVEAEFYPAEPSARLVQIMPKGYRCYHKCTDADNDYMIVCGFCGKKATAYTKDGGTAKYCMCRKKKLKVEADARERWELRRAERLAAGLEPGSSPPPSPLEKEHVSGNEWSDGTDHFKYGSPNEELSPRDGDGRGVFPRFPIRFWAVFVLVLILVFYLLFIYFQLLCTL